MPQLAKSYTAPASVLLTSTELGTPKDFNEQQALGRRNVGYLLDAALSGGAQLRAFGDALKVTANGADMDLTVTGLAPILWRLAADPGAPDPQVLLHQLGADDTFTADAADGSNPRIDVFSAKVEDGDEGDPSSVIVKDGTTGAITSQSFNKRTRTKLTVTYTPGTPAASPVAPAPPAGEVVFAEVLVDTGVSLLEQEDVTDSRSRYPELPAPPADPGELLSLDSEGQLQADGRHGERTLVMSPHGGAAASGASWGITNGMLSFNDSSTLWTVPVPLRAGDRFLRARVRVRDGTANPNVTRARLLEIDDGVTGSQNELDAADSADSQAWQTLDLEPATPYLVASADTNLVIRVQRISGTDTTYVRSIEIDFDRP
jgi:hypothetical protein